MTPVIAVFSTYELLERILANLPIRDLFVSQRTSTAWQAIILRSNTIRKKMFLAADGDVVHPVPEYQHLDTDKLSPCYHSILRFDPALGFYRNALRHHGGAEWRGWRKWANYEFSAWDKHVVIGMQVMPAYNNGFPDRVPKAYYHPKASWRMMFATQPPVSAVNYHDHAVQRHDPSWNLNLKGQVCTIRNLEGVNLGEMHDMRQQFAREEEVKTGRPYDSRGGGMAICVALPFQDTELDEVFKSCRDRNHKDRLL